jgi:hypothetical protein
MTITASSSLDRKLFPDGLKTSGQHPVLPDAIYPYERFPEKIDGPTVWQPEEFQDNPDKWTHPFSTEEIEELGKAADAYIESGQPLTGISKVSMTADRRSALMSGPIPPPQPRFILRPAPNQTGRWTRLHPFQKHSCQLLVESQMRRSVPRSGYSLWLLYLSKWQRPYPRSCPEPLGRLDQI